MSNRSQPKPAGPQGLAAGGHVEGGTGLGEQVPDAELMQGWRADEIGSIQPEARSIPHTPPYPSFLPLNP